MSLDYQSVSEGQNQWDDGDCDVPSESAQPVSQSYTVLKPNTTSEFVNILRDNKGNVKCSDRQSFSQRDEIEPKAENQESKCNQIVNENLYKSCQVEPELDQLEVDKDNNGQINLRRSTWKTQKNITLDKYKFWGLNDEMDSYEILQKLSKKSK